MTSLGHRLMLRIEALEKRVQYLMTTDRRAVVDFSSGAEFRVHENVARAVGRLVPRSLVSGITGEGMAFYCEEPPREDFKKRLQSILDDAYVNDDCPAQVTVKEVVWMDWCADVTTNDKMYVTFTVNYDSP